MNTPYDQAVSEALEASKALQAARRNLAQTAYNHSRDNSAVILGLTPKWTTEEAETIDKALRSLEDTLDATYAAYQAAESARVRWLEEVEAAAEAAETEQALKYLDSLHD